VHATLEFFFQNAQNYNSRYGPKWTFWSKCLNIKVFIISKPWELIAYAITFFCSGMRSQSRRSSSTTKLTKLIKLIKLTKLTKLEGVTKGDNLNNSIQSRKNKGTSESSKKGRLTVSVSS
jgi:hypothetical protein